MSLNGWRTFAGLSRSERTFVGLAWVLALPATAAVSALGFRRTTSMLDKLSIIKAVARIGRPNQAVTVERGEQLVRGAFRNSLAPGGCLPESIVQYTLHVVRGQPVKLVLGVRRAEAAPVAAHAWVENASGPQRDLDHAVIYELFGP